MAKERDSGVKRPPLELRIGRIATPLGAALLVWDADARLRALDFADCAPRMVRLLRIEHGSSGFRLTEERAPSPLDARLEAFCAGDVGAIDTLPIAPGGTAFQRAVWTALRAIPAGTTTTYASLAAVVGRPTACRAVGAANGANPIAIVVPCHRVIGANGSLTGFAAGLDNKRALLELEAGVLALA